MKYLRFLPIANNNAHFSRFPQTISFTTTFSAFMERASPRARVSKRMCKEADQGKRIPKAAAPPVPPVSTVENAAPDATSPVSPAAQAPPSENAPQAAAEIELKPLAHSAAAPEKSFTETLAKRTEYYSDSVTEGSYSYDYTAGG
jgi:hypothetical protein